MIVSLLASASVYSLSLTTLNVAVFAAKAVAGTRETTIAAAMTIEINFFIGLIPPFSFLNVRFVS